MIPLLFGSAERPLLGVYSPSARRGEGRGVVICPPLGQEYIRSHRTCRILASRLSEAGHDVLRIDYFGTGNSGGEAEDLSVSGAVEDTLSGVREIGDLAGVRRVSVVGLRAGSMIAALAAARSRVVDKLVLWDPVSDGATYVRHDIGSGDALGEDGDRQLLGFLFTRALQTELSKVALVRFDGFPARVLLVVSEDRPEHRLLRAHLEKRGVSTDFARLENPPAWTELGHVGVGAVPADVLKTIVDW